MRDRAALDELDRLAAEGAVGLREPVALLEILDAGPRLLESDLGRVTELVEEAARLLRLGFHAPILFGRGVATHALDRLPGALVDGVTPLVERGLGRGRRRRHRLLDRPGLIELALQLVRGIGR